VKTVVEIDGEKFLLNDRLTYKDVRYRNFTVEGLLMNSRMIQAIADDENPETRKLWANPDTGAWDPERNTREFCEALPVYRKSGLLAVTVGLQAGGSVYSSKVWNNCRMSGFAPDGAVKPAWKKRLLKVLKAADDCGMVVIINLFYWKQIRLIPDDKAVIKAVESACDLVLCSGFRNVIVDVANESASWWNRPVCRPENIHRLILAAKAASRNGRRLLVGSSTGGDNLPTGEWLEAEDVSLPHGNGNTPDRLRQRIRELRSSDAFRKRPRPLLINEDSVNLANMETSLEEYCSWGYYSQGAGSADPQYEKIWPGAREKRYGDLSGFQTLPVNWGVNTAQKRAFFDKVAEVTGGE